MFINESFVSFLWQYSYFDLTGLTLVNGRKLDILSPGHLNVHAGPDFNDAKIRIDGLLWIGAVEIHVKSSHWDIHHHQKNNNYNKVILHVVWEHDRPALRPDGSELPTLALNFRVADNLINKYRSLIFSPAGKVACSAQLARTKEITVLGMIQKALINRLERKSFEIDRLLKEHNNDWEQTTYRWIVRNFGFKVNQDNMYLLSRFIPLKLVLRLGDDLFRLEALLFGVAGFLEDEKDEYQRRLKKEYMFLRHKYQLDCDFLKRYQWKFLRLHPQNFPTIRIAQLASFITRINNFFSYIIQAEDPAKIHKDFEVSQSSYWQRNYDFGEPSKKKLAGLGKFSIDNLIINSIAPLLVAYGRYTDNPSFMNRALSLLENTNYESNRIVRCWKNLGIKIRNASDSQGLIELYNQYCYKKQCLNCNIGAEILLNLN
jgi:hypothetical protein